MPYIPDELVEEVRSRSDIVDVVGSYVKLTKKGSSYFGLCPFHNEKTSSFSVSVPKQMFYCFGCHKGGSVFRFIQDYENMDFPEAVRLLADRCGVELPEGEMSNEERQKANLRNTLLEMNVEAARYFNYLLGTPVGDRARAYLEMRQLTPETTKAWGLGVTPPKSDGLYQYLKKKGYSDEVLKKSGLCVFSEKGVRDKFYNRLMFPFLNVNKKVVGFGGRVMGDGEPKYMNSPETLIFEKSRNLFGLYNAKNSKTDHFIVCEGNIDVISLHQAGFTQAVAPLGTSFTSQHAMMLKKYGRKVLVCFDSDFAGMDAAIRCIGLLREVGIATKVINMKPYKDPDEFIKALGAEAFQERIHQAENSFLFEIHTMERKYDIQDPTGRTDFFTAVAERLLGFTEELERDNYLEAIAADYQISAKGLRDLLIKVASRGTRKPTQPKTTVPVRTAEKDDGVLKAQRMLLTWMADDPRLYAKIVPYVRPEDFTEEAYAKVAAQIYADLEKGTFNPSALADYFAEGEAADLVARLLNTEIVDEDADALEREQALNEAVLIVKRNSLEKQSQTVSDLSVLQDLMKQKSNLNKIHISLS